MSHPMTSIRLETPTPTSRSCEILRKRFLEVDDWVGLKVDLLPPLKIRTRRPVAIPFSSDKHLKHLADLGGPRGLPSTKRPGSGLCVLGNGTRQYEEEVTSVRQQTASSVLEDQPFLICERSASTEHDASRNEFDLFWEKAMQSRKDEHIDKSEETKIDSDPFNLDRAIGFKLGRARAQSLSSKQMASSSLDNLSMLKCRNSMTSSNATQIQDEKFSIPAEHITSIQDDSLFFEPGSHNYGVTAHGEHSSPWRCKTTTSALAARSSDCDARSMIEYKDDISPDSSISQV